MRCYGIWMGLWSLALAQRGFGLSFQGRFNHFTDTGEPVPMGWFSDGAIGATYKNYWWGAGFEVGVVWVYKGGPQEMRLPLINRDFRQGQITAYKAVEGAFRFGPRWKVFYLRMGLVAGYRYQQLYLSDPQSGRSPNRWYATLPLGLSIELPTSFGTTGFSGYYEIGLTNHLKRPAGETGNYEGTKLRRITFEVHVMWGKI
jgi:hypothetical protein